MKKTSIFLILATAVAMMFTSCKAILGEDTTATLEDYRGAWSYNIQQGTYKGTQILLTIDGKNAVLQGLPNGEQELSCAILENGLLKAVNVLTDEKFMMTINPSKTLITVTSETLSTQIKEYKIVMNKILDFGTFIPDTQATFDDFLGEWSGTTSDGINVSFIFNYVSVTGQSSLQNVTITGLPEGTLSGLVLCVSGTATFTTAGDNSKIFTMFINKNHDVINVTGAATLRLRK